MRRTPSFLVRGAACALLVFALSSHVLAHSVAFITAQSKHYREQESGFVFEDCKVTADSGTEYIFMGPPWRPYATVVFVNTDLQAQIEPAGWREWHPGEIRSLKTAFYAESHSTGPGAGPKERVPMARQLGAGEVHRYSMAEFVSGADGWMPRPTP